MDGFHSPIPHLHPSNSTKLQQHQCHTSGSHACRKEGDKTRVLSFTQSPASFLSCAETFLLISQPLPHQHGIGFWLRQHWLLSCYTYLSPQRIWASGAQQRCSHHSTQPFLEQSHKSTARFSPDLSEMCQSPAATSTWTGMLLFRVIFSPHQVWPRLVGFCSWVKCIFFWLTDAFVWLALLFLRDHPQPMQLLPCTLFLFGSPESVAFSD